MKIFDFNVVFSVLVLSGTLCFTACELENLEGASCPDGQISCSGKCVSYTSSNNCGSCENTCSPEEKCAKTLEGKGYACVNKCEDGKRFCNGQCLEAYDRNDHCGACGRACGGGQICKKKEDGGYSCVRECETDEQKCGDLCVKFSDANNCGACGKKCEGELVCKKKEDGTHACLKCETDEQKCDGRCVKFSDANNCGACGNECVGDKKCEKTGGSYQCLGSCENGRRDPGEVAVDCGGNCEQQCKACSVNANKIPCGEGEFCDSAAGYVCSKKCVPDNGKSNTASRDCLEDQICRADGRCSSKYFTTVWKLENDGESIELPGIASGTCDFFVDWGDGTTAEIKDCSAEKRTHTYQTKGEYEVKISGVYKWAGSQASGNMRSLKEVKSWGTVQLGNNAFMHAANLEKLPEDEVPDATLLTTMSGMFAHIENFNGKIEHWDTSNVSDFSNFCFGCKVFNRDIGKWDTSKAETMSWTFSGMEAFNQDIGKWDVSNVTAMTGMFSNAKSFNQDIGNWDVSNVTAMSANAPVTHSSARAPIQPKPSPGMFLNAESFNQDIRKWKVSKVKDMRSLFQGARAFNQDLSEWNLEGLKSGGIGSPAQNAFKDSGLKDGNYCKMIAKGWKLFIAQLGFTPELPCETLSI